jgi:hypothetical protein
MRRLQRPSDESRQRWEGLGQTINAKAHITELAAKLTLVGESPMSHDFDSAWTEPRWADDLADAQDSLCAWCTVRPLDGGHTGAIDHIRPRSQVTRDIAKPGRQIGARGRVQGRPLVPNPPLRPGYYWLAYEPQNLAYCCERCNTGWKRTLWPVEPWRTGAAHVPPVPGAQEIEIVLDPFDQTFDPFDHFQFGPFGAILPRPGDRRAEATIVTFQLDRDELCDARRKQHADLELQLKSVQRILREQIVDEDSAGMIRLLAERCAWSRPHAAFYRAALRSTLEKLTLSWALLRAAWDRLGAAGDLQEPRADTWVD